MSAASRTRLALIGAAVALPACQAAYLDPVTRGVCGVSAGAPVRAARAFTESLGAQVHLAWSGTAFSDYPRLVADLQAMGIRHVRDGSQGATMKPEPYRDLAKHGAAVMLQLHVDADVTRLVSEVGPALEAVQVPTPGDGSSGYPPKASIPERTRAVAQEVRRLRPEARPAIVGAVLTDLDVDLAQYVDFAAFTYQPGNPSATADARLASAARAYPGRPIVATGGQGYATVPGRETPVTELVQAKYVLRLFLEQFARGVERTYYFRLYDTAETHGEGLAGEQAEPRLAYHALAALTSLLLDREVSGPRAALPITVQPGPSAPAPRHLLLGKSDGSFVVLLWLPVSSTDDEVTAPVRLILGVPTKAVVAHDLRTRASTPLARAGNAFDVVASDFPVAVSIVPDCD